MRHLSAPRTNLGHDMSLDVKSRMKFLDLASLDSLTDRLPSGPPSIFLHQNCTTRLRSLGRASAKYSVRGEPVTFFAVSRTFGALQHHWANHVKRVTKQARGPVFTRFSHMRARYRKITATFLRFVHACCISNVMDYRRASGSGRLKPIKTVAGLPDGDSSVLPGTLL